ncbi:hypothetical protein [Streptomyces sp. NPDC091268]|uniref:hypothetical protein n=1 Tax=Streptomyces sp. NPDC091268 TaxID=3365979 RepID=UPI00381417A1
MIRPALTALDPLARDVAAAIPEAAPDGDRTRAAAPHDHRRGARARLRRAGLPARTARPLPVADVLGRRPAPADAGAAR